MKKYLIIGLLLISSTAYADNAIRIKELTNEFEGLKVKQQEYSQVLQNIIIRQAQINGIVSELESQDKPKDKAIKSKKGI